ncbi:ROK family protein [Vibrio mangrovi]|uniref:N-acetylglucosamine repressor n=1 Tax=Vibrio mangrovi TaxID=474394 RepID=A0A1Y6IPK2_9VIBR|nr:ROK family protein [Vibrio mangrovi]MDW6003631.1 ROK family protein [Vibrio mangrovi]SMR99577.1 N-acetylglucosamine repressor [Vibrio mangrovi]
MVKRSGRVTNHEQLKQVNAALVYQLIDLEGPISRVSIAQQSALAPASVTNITRQLLAHNLITEVEQQASTGGRPAISLTTNQQDFYFVSCRLGRDVIQCSLMDLAGTTHHLQQVPIEQHDTQGIVDTLRHEICQLLTQYATHRLIAIAITMAGLVDPTSGMIHYSPNHKIAGLKLSAALEDLALPVYIGNDIRARALSEYYLGEARQCDDFILISIHSGVGAGIITDGQLLLGRHRPIGEIGHVQIDPFGQRCHCGSFGCLETVVSNQALLEQAAALLQRGHQSSLSAENLTIDQICAAAVQGDSVANHLIQQAAKHLGQVLGMLVNVFNPEKILFAGEIIQSAPVLFPLLLEQIQRQALPSFAGDLRLEQARFQRQDTMGGYALIKRALHESDLLRQIMNDDH